LGTVRIRLIPLGKEITVKKGTSLIDILHEYGVEFPCGGKGSCGKCAVKVLQGQISADPGHRHTIAKLGLGSEWRLACLSSAEEDLELEVGQFEAMIQADETPFEFIPAEGFGVALDLGTTSLVAQLVDLNTAKVLAVETGLNPQRKHGSDLISRLEYALSHGSEGLQGMIRKELGEMLSKLLRGRQIHLEKVLMVGNTAMQHLFAGLDIKPLSYYPFESPRLEALQFSSKDLDWDISCDLIRFCPSIGSFVGSDILAGIFATGMWEKEEYTVLVDLGTNGEIVVGNRDGLLCASTAAGPAFEGSRISSGMLATTGAISSVESSAEGIFCKVIGNVPAKGICGSGLIDAVAVLLERGQLGEFGEILSGEDRVNLEAEVGLTQKDIQEFQLAKAAIAAGLLILLRTLGIKNEDVADIYIAGAFGTYIDLQNMVSTGMMDFPLENFHKLGNSALIGAKMLLYADSSTEEKILSVCQHVNLESEADFQDVFVNQLSFNQPTS
jgi:uncharacterized 2Fe-2S/4Fe-4S cluster protein (DUF4445 family)